MKIPIENIAIGETFKFVRTAKNPSSPVWQIVEKYGWGGVLIKQFAQYVGNKPKTRIIEGCTVVVLDFD